MSPYVFRADTLEEETEWGTWVSKYDLWCVTSC